LSPDFRPPEAVDAIQNVWEDAHRGKLTEEEAVDAHAKKGGIKHPVKLSEQSQADPIVQALYRYRQPVNRANYLRLAGLPRELQLENQAPRRLVSPPPRHMESTKSTQTKEKASLSPTVPPSQKQPKSSRPSVRTTKSGFRFVDATKTGRTTIILGLPRPR